MLSAALFLCAGSSTRMSGRVGDKILAHLAGRPVVSYSMEAFRKSGMVDCVVVVHRDDEQRQFLEIAFNQCDTSGIEILWSQGGKERQDSVFNGLAEIPLDRDYAFIHDCARPLITPDLIRRLHAAVLEDKAAVLAHRVTDTIKKVSATRRTTRCRTLRDVPRSSLWAMETPQVFERELILDAYRRIRYDRNSVTDDTAAATLMGHKVTLIENTEPNPKLTVPADLEIIEYLLSRRHPLAQA